MARAADVAGVVVVMMMVVLCDGAAVGKKPQPVPQQIGNSNLYADLNNGSMADKYQTYALLGRNAMFYELRKYPTGKWLKIKQRPYLADLYYKEIQEYINGNNSLNTPLALGTPMVIRFDLKPIHVQRFVRYKYLRQQALALSKKVLSTNVQSPSPTNGNNPGQAPKTADQIALENITDTAYMQLLALLGDNNVTVYSYLNGRYQTNTPLPKNPDLSVITVPEFTVYSKGYYDSRGIEDSYEVAHNLTSQLRRPLTSYYLADYMYTYTGVRDAFYYEVWLPHHNLATSLLP